MSDLYDVVGVGFGPSNLALAIALTEHNAQVGPGERVRGRFLERQPRFGWHRGMLIEDATMQVSFLKDLVTMRNPSSGFSFLCYLRDRGRLVDFINHKNLFPLRTEFHDYFEWAAAQVEDLVTYGTNVTDLGFDGSCLRVGGHRARNVMLATGLR
ncbi:SidA/IucD/PvdA family monooxygenase, partial [Kibdelosporangium lantanae]